MSDKDCLCGGSGVIFDYGPQGEPCPECVGGKFSMRGQAAFKAEQMKMRGGCAVIAIVAGAVITVAADAISRLAG